MGALIVSALLSFSPADAAAIRAVDVDDDAIVLRFDESVGSASSFALDGPQRIAVDLQGVDPSSARGAGGPVAAMRQARFDPATTRVVFDLAAPAVVRSGSFSEDGRALTLKLASVDDDVFANEVSRGRARFQLAGFLTAPAKPRNRITVPLGAPQRRWQLPPVEGTSDRTRPLVVIDAGHGGHDTGAVSVYENRKEKDAALAIAKAIRDELVASGRVRVALTRADDRFLVLDERREIARRLNADLFISVHCDSAPSPNARGATVYTLSEVSSDKVAARLAARENRSDVINGIDLGGESQEVSTILIDLTQRETMNVAANFAGLLQREMASTVDLKSTFHRFAGLVVLKAPDVPSVLLETGYVSNMDDAKLLWSSDHQREIAKGVRRAVIAHFARRLKPEQMAAAN